MNLDLSSLDTISACNAGAEVQLHHPATGVPLNIFITVLGRDSDVFKQHTRSTINERLRREAMAKRRGKEAEVLTVESAELSNIEVLVSCTQKWRTGTLGSSTDCITFRDVAHPCTPENARMIYTALPWIARQVDESIGDLENFMKI